MGRDNAVPFRRRPVDVMPPPDRGELLTPEEVAERFFRGRRPAQWVRRNVRPRVRLGHSTVMFYEADVRAWIEGQRERAG